MGRRYPKFSSAYELSLGDLPLDDAGFVDWAAVFGRSGPLRVEIGVGNSRFLVEVALRSPEGNYLGFEHSRKRVLKFLKKVEKEGLANIRVLPVNALVVLDWAFRPGSVDAFYIHHPDPWPKRRHAKKRLIRPEVAARLCALLRPGGGLSLRTDDEAYARQMLEVLDATEGLFNRSGKGRCAEGPLDPFPTAYEARYLEEGRRIHYLEYARAPLSEPARRSP